MSEPFPRRFVLGVVVSLLFAVHAPAAVHMADSFLSGVDPLAGQYSVGTLVGQNPTVSSFNSAWADGLAPVTPGTFDAVAAGLTWPDLSGVAGGTVQFVNDGGFTNTQSAVRTFDNLNMAVDGNYYLVGIMSFDANFYASTNSSAFTGVLNAQENDPSVTYYTGMQWGFRGNATGGVDAVVRYRDKVSSVYAVREYVLATDVTPGSHLFVTYVDSDYDPALSNDWNDVWFDPSVGNGFYSAGPSQLSRQGANWVDPPNANVVDTVVLTATDLGADAVVKYDEVRLGDTWQDVVSAGGNVSSTGATFFANPVDPYDHAGVYYRESGPDSARGTHTVLQVGSVTATPPATSRLRSSLSFSLDAVPNGTTVTSASLKLYVSRVDETDGEAAIDLYLADLPDNFDETTATWNSAGMNDEGFPIAWGSNGPGNPTSLLASVTDLAPGPDPPMTTEVVFSSSALLAAIQSAINGDTPLDLALIAPADIENSGLRRFVEFYSDDAANYFLRPVLMLSFVAVPGDTNGDGKVNDVDAQTVAEHWGIASATGPSQGDFNADGHVNAADASILAANWGHGVSEGASVPEPSMLLLVAAMSAVVVVLRRRRTG